MCRVSFGEDSFSKNIHLRERDSVKLPSRLGYCFVFFSLPLSISCDPIPKRSQLMTHEHSNSIINSLRLNFDHVCIQSDIKR